MDRRSAARWIGAAAALSLTLCAGASPAETTIPDPSDMVRGKPTAPVTIVEYASIGCPHCAALHNGPFKAFKARYIDTGKVRWVSREVIAGDEYIATGGYLLARCASKARYFDVIDAIYRDQEAIHNDLHTGLLTIAKSVGLTQDQFNTCLRSPANLEALEKRLALAQTDNVKATPTLIVDGMIVAHGEVTLADLEKIITDAQASRKKK